MTTEQKQNIVERLRRLDKISHLPTNIFVDAIAHIEHLEAQLARAALSQSQYANALEELDCMNKNYQALMVEFRALKALRQPPVRPVALSDEQIVKLWGDYEHPRMTAAPFEFARAILATQEAK